MSHSFNELPSVLWRFAPGHPQAAADLARQLGADPLLSRILAARGFDSPQAAAQFLQPSLASIHDPFLLKDMDIAAERAARALERREKIAVFGDYDADGLTATALIVRLFRELGVEPAWRIPHRINEGYGLSVEAVEEMARAGIQLILTVDNGVTSLEEIARANQLGVDVVVTDHHLPGGELPPAAAVVDPHRVDCSYPCEDLAGVGVAFKFAHALLKRVNADPERSRAFLREQLDLVAIGSISDIVPLVGENRALARHGLAQLERGAKAGTRAMLDVLGLGGEKGVSARAAAFVIGPRLNVAGRIGEADLALELLLTSDESKAREIVRHLSRQNDERRRIESEIFDEAVEMIESDPSALDNPILVLANEGWHRGVVGIVASRLMQRYSRPALVLERDRGRLKGSARGLEGIDLIEALDACAEWLTTHGGHARAAGLELPEDQLDDFRRTINEFARERLGGRPFEPGIDIDAEARIEEATLEAIGALAAMEPHGCGNPRPVVALRGVRLADPPRIVGTNHLKLALVDNGRTLGAIGFGLGRHAAWLRAHAGAIDVAGALSINEFNGRQSPQIEIEAIRPAE